MEKSSASMQAVPGADLVERGIEDLRNERDSIEALLVSIGAPRLALAGIAVPTPIPSPEHKLYARLVVEKANGAHSAYNALIRRLVSFERAAGCGS
jgi:hypothetical protein